MAKVLSILALFVTVSGSDLSVSAVLGLRKKKSMMSGLSIIMAMVATGISHRMVARKLPRSLWRRH